MTTSEITDEQRLVIFRRFLTETPPDLLRDHDLLHAPDYFADRLVFEAWRARWLPYLAGLADGPTNREQYAVLRPRLYAGHRPEVDQMDRFHS